MNARATTLSHQLTELAVRYETADFLPADPSLFMHQVRGDLNREAMAFVAAAISYGSRRQFMPKIQAILDATGGDVDAWLRHRAFADAAASPLAFSPADTACFYRLQTRADMYAFFQATADVLCRYGSLHSFAAEAVRADCIAMPRHRPQARPALAFITALTRHFADGGSRGVIPKDATSACKRVCMFLRWMVRQASPVDLGLWADIIAPEALIMPLDTHVMQQAARLGLITAATTSMSTALRLTEAVAQVFPNDPLRADFALFGYGVNAKEQ